MAKRARSLAWRVVSSSGWMWVCTLWRPAASCFGGRPERGASRIPARPRTAKDCRHLPTVTAGTFSAAAICWLFEPSAADKTGYLYDVPAAPCKSAGGRSRALARGRAASNEAILCQARDRELQTSCPAEGVSGFAVIHVRKRAVRQTDGGGCIYDLPSGGKASARDRLDPIWDGQAGRHSR
jgi:hypothetical protein